jgi:transposase
VAYDDYGKWRKVKLTEQDWRVLENHDNLFAAFGDLAETVQRLESELYSQGLEYEKKIKTLEVRIQDLEKRFLKDSHNSHRPPASDTYGKGKAIKRTRSLRKKSGKKPGAQAGHAGKTRLQYPNPDEIFVHPLTQCKGCGKALQYQSALSIERRQIVDLRQGSIYVVEHRAERKRCSRCQRLTRASFPEDAPSYLSYGAGVKSLALYFTVYQLIPVARTCEIFLDLFELRISTGSICNIQFQASCDLKDWENQTKKELIQSEIAHFDESGIRCEGSNFWIHVASQETHTLLYPHPFRGQKAWDEFGVIPEFGGISVHDGFKSYFSYTQCRHVLCNVHHLRELTFIDEVENEAWAKQMKRLLEQANLYLSQCLQKGRRPSSKRLKSYEKEYYRILSQGYHTHHESMKKTWHKAKSQEKRSPGLNLLNRMRDHHREVLAFLLHWDLGIPFSNNQAERDIRMAKIKQKISGGFRSYRGAQSFCRVRSYLSTLKKQGISPLVSLMLAFY